VSTQYNGNAGNITQPVAVAIASSTNTNPVVVQTSTAHGLTTGDTVDITGHAVNTNANGENEATVVDATHFSIPVAGNGVGAATGQVQPRAVGTFAIPSDGDDDDGASVDVAFETLADRTARLEVKLGAVKIYDIDDVVIQDDHATEQTNWLGSSFTFSAQNTWQVVGGIASPTQGILQPGDLIDYELHFSVQWADTAATGIGMLLGLGVGFSGAGTLPVGSSIIGGTGKVVPESSSNGGRTGMILRGRVRVPIFPAAPTQTAEFFLYAYTRSASFSQISFTTPGDAIAYQTIYRPLGVLQ
jgi:hypothetical protein